MKPFEILALKTLEGLHAHFERCFGDEAEIDLEEGVLRVEFEDKGIYLLNRHAPLSQIWLSSPKSGAWHFALETFADSKEIDWRSTRGEKISLYALLNQELSPPSPFTKQTS